MRKNIVAGNWKMNKTFHEAEDFLNEFMEMLDEKTGKTELPQIIICTPSLYLDMVSDMAIEYPFEAGSQDVSMFENGAYTGDISAEMLNSIMVKYSIVGHSERRTYYGETDENIAKKVDNLLKFGITPIYCCGEVLSQREENKHFDVIKAQVEKALFHLTEVEIKKVVIAYEPVWAIGTGKTATSEQAQEMHAHIRQLLKAKYGENVANSISILYGGSCNAKNAKELFSNPDVDGGLIGGASLKPDTFLQIIESF